MKKNVTTIIAQGKTFTADRRKVINYHKVGMVGIRDEAKISKTPYGLIGTTGFEFSGAKDAKIYKEYHQKLAILAILTYCSDQRFFELPIYKAMKHANKGEEYAASFFNWRTNMRNWRDILGRHFAKDIVEWKAGFIMMLHERTLVGDEDGFLTYDNRDAVIVGSGKKMATILLDHGVPKPEIYHALRQSGVPTGTKIDEFTIEKDLPDLFPPITDLSFQMAFTTHGLRSITKDKKDGVIDADKALVAHEELTAAVATWLSFGELKKGVFHFNKDLPIFDWDDNATRVHPAWKRAVEITKFDQEKIDKLAEKLKKKAGKK